MQNPCRKSIASTGESFAATDRRQQAVQDIDSDIEDQRNGDDGDQHHGREFHPGPDGQHRIAYAVGWIVDVPVYCSRYAEREELCRWPVSSIITQ